MPAESWADLLSNAGDAAQSYEVLPTGDYDVKVEKAEVKFAQSSGNKMYNLTLVVESGPYEGRKLWKDLVLAQSSGGLGMFFRQMTALGLDNKFFASNPTDEIITQQLVDRRASAKTEVDDKYDGTPRNKVAFLNAPKGPAPVGSAQAGPGAAVPAFGGAATSVADAPPVTPRPAAPAADPWASATPPTMPGLGQEDPF